MKAQLQPGTIVVAVDGSADSARAVRWAAEQAYVARRRLAVVTVAYDVPAVTDAVALARQHRAGLSIDSHVLPGDPTKVLVDLSAEAQLIVMGSRGQGTVRSVLLGSVSAAVSERARCPVVVCRPGPDIGGQGVVVGASGTRKSEPVIEFAFRQASLRAQPLTVLHCIEEISDVAWLQILDDPEMDMEQGRLLLSDAVAGLGEKFPEVDVTLELVRGFAKDVLTAADRRWDLVVVGRRTVTALTRLVTGSLSTSVLKRTCTTMAIVPEAGPNS